MATRSPFTICLLVLLACASRSLKFVDVAPADELYAQGQETLEGRRILWILRQVDHEKAIETFQTIVDNYPYSDYAVLAELAIADAYFDDSKYEEALSYYRDFADLHPHNEKVPYTIYRSALCHERHVEKAYRDQTATREALIYLDRLLDLYPHSEYATKGEILWRDLRTRLARSVLGIANFYRKRGEFEAAAERYRSILNEYPGLGLDARALYHLGECYAEMNRGPEAEQIFQAVLQNYRDSDVADDALNRIKEAN